MLCGSYLRDISSRKRFLQRVLVMKQQEQIIKEKTKKERMQKDFLHSILPPSLVDSLKEVQVDFQRSRSRKTSATSLGRVQALSKRHKGVCVLYADLVGFTAFSAQVDPFKVMSFLNDLFAMFDGLCDDFNVYKIETVGDCYVASVGVVTGKQVSSSAPPSTDTSKDLLGLERTLTLFHRPSVVKNASSLNATDLVEFAKAMIWGSRRVMKPEVGAPATLRVGLHTGTCISGIIGTRNLKFSLLGDDITTAALMEKTGIPDHIHASEDIAELVPGEAWQKCKVVETDDDERSIQTHLLKV